LIVEREALEDFSEFVRTVEPRLRLALSSAFGVIAGREAAADALVFAWEHWERVRVKKNPVGYLWGVGRNMAVRARPRPRRPGLLPIPEGRLPEVEPRLPLALARLSEKQRTTVMLVYCFEWTYSEMADLLGIAKGSVQNHAHRGINALRRELGVTL
jgi:DNA-directed RNA polymerase specialized sigma24 family protein